MFKPRNSTKNSKYKHYSTAGMLALFGGLVLTTALVQPQISPNGGVSLEMSKAHALMPAGHLSFADLVETVKPAVVSVQVKSDIQHNSTFQGGPNFFEDLPEGHPLDKFFDQFKRFADPDQRQKGERKRPNRPRRNLSSQGSGFIISKDGYVVTNHHVVNEGTEITVVMNDGAEYDAKLIGSDEKTDLALLKVEAKADLPVAKFAEEGEDVRVGDWVIAVGNPFGLGGTVTAGIVSARGRELGGGSYNDFIQIDAAVNKGNSGGPAFNLQGDVIGVNTAIYSPTGGNVGIAFAIPTATVKSIIEDLKDDGTVTRGYLGVNIQPVSDDIASSMGLEDTSGAMVTEPRKDTPAERAGIKSGDIITEVNGKEVESPRDLAIKIGSINPGEEVKITFWRNGKRQEVSLKLDTLENANVAAATPKKEIPKVQVMKELGLELSNTSPSGEPLEGLMIKDIDPGSEAAMKNLRAGDVIVEVAGKTVQSVKEFSEIIQDDDVKNRGAVLLKILRDDKASFVAIPLEKDQG